MKKKYIYYFNYILSMIYYLYTKENERERENDTWLPKKRNQYLFSSSSFHLQTDYPIFLFLPMNPSLH